MTNPYQFEEYKPKKKKKRNRERKYTNRFLNMMVATGGLGRRYPDDSALHFKHDGFLFLDGKYMPFEAKFMDGGLTYNTAAWIKKQPHQFDSLCEYYQKGAFPFFLMIWKRHGRIEFRAKPIHLVPLDKITISKMTLIERMGDLMYM